MKFKLEIFISLVIGSVIFTTVSSNEIDKTFELLEEYKGKLNESDSKEVVLILGNSGSGRSTLLQWLFGDASKLISKEVGAGEFKIENNVDSQKTSSIIPKLVEKEKIFYFDCPGFSESQSSKLENAINYFIKELLKYAEKVKIIFVVEYSSVRIGEGPENFIRSTRRLTNLVNNVKKLDGSIALVVTKVDNILRKVGKNFVLVDDDEIQENVGKFLEKVKKNLDESLKKTEVKKEIEKFENEINLINIFMKRDEGKLSRIGLFRRPDETGPLNEIELLQEQKEKLLEKIKNKLKFTDLSDYDIDDETSEGSVDDVKNVLNIISNPDDKPLLIDLIKVRFQLIAIAIYNHYNKEIENFELQDLPKTLKIGYDSMQEVEKSTNTFSKFESFSESVPELLSKFNIADLKSENFKSELKIELKDLEEWILNKSDFPAVKSAIFNEALENTLKFLKESYNWFYFLNEMDTKSYNFDFHKAIEDYSNQCTEPITKENFKGFLRIIEKLKIKGHDLIANYKPNSQNLLALNDLIKSIASKPSLECSDMERIATFKGDYIKLTELFDTQGKYIKNCINTQNLTIYARKTIFIDRDLEKFYEASMISPQIEVIGNRKFNFDGPETYIEKSNVTYSNGDGMPGMAGNPGLPFLLIADRVKNGEKLSITSNGSNGAPGTNGKSGKHVRSNSFSIFSSTCGPHNDYKSKIETIVNNYKINLYYPNIEYEKETSGDGGMGGLGGLKGSVEVLVNEPAKIKIITNDGINGQPGKKGNCEGKSEHFEGAVTICEDKRSVDYQSVLIKTENRCEKEGCDGCSGKQNLPEKAAVIDKNGKIKEYEEFFSQNKKTLRLENVDTFERFLEKIK